MTRFIQAIRLSIFYVKKQIFDFLLYFLIFFVKKFFFVLGFKPIKEPVLLCSVFDFLYFVLYKYSIVKLFLFTITFSSYLDYWFPVSVMDRTAPFRDIYFGTIEMSKPFYPFLPVTDDILYSTGDIFRSDLSPGCSGLHDFSRQIHVQRLKYRIFSCALASFCSSLLWVIIFQTQEYRITGSIDPYWDRGI